VLSINRRNADRKTREPADSGIILSTIIIGAMQGGATLNHSSKNTSNKDGNYEYIVPAVDRAARILMLLRKEMRGMTIAELTEATGWHKSSVHKLLVTLNHHGLLDRSEDTKRYSLGIALIGYGQFVLNNLDIANKAKSVLKELSEYSGETANYCILRGNQLVIVDSIESKIALRVAPPVGTMNSVTIKSNGKAVMAFLPEGQVNRILQSEGLPAFTNNSITEIDAYHRELAAIRKRGYATDFEEFREGISAISAPVFNSSGQIVGTLSLVAPAFRITNDKIASYGKKCAEEAAQLSAMMLHS
jgi:IclR family transcriptional regulator, KDG regulon repressor